MTTVSLDVKSLNIFVFTAISVHLNSNHAFGNCVLFFFGGGEEIRSPPSPTKLKGDRTQEPWRTPMGNIIITKGPPLFSFRIQKFPRNKKYPDSPVHTLTDSLRIFILFLLWIAHLKISGCDSLSNSLDACGQKLYPERKQIRVEGALQNKQNQKLLSSEEWNLRKSILMYVQWQTIEISEIVKPTWSFLIADTIRYILAMREQSYIFQKVHASETLWISSVSTTRECEVYSAGNNIFTGYVRRNKCGHSVASAGSNMVRTSYRVVTFLYVTVTFFGCPLAFIKYQFHYDSILSLFCWKFPLIYYFFLLTFQCS